MLKCQLVEVSSRTLTREYNMHGYFHAKASMVTRDTIATFIMFVVSILHHSCGFDNRIFISGCGGNALMQWLSLQVGLARQRVATMETRPHGPMASPCQHNAHYYLSVQY